MLRLFALIVSVVAHLLLFGWLLSKMDIVQIFQSQPAQQAPSAQPSSQNQTLAEIDLATLPAPATAKVPSVTTEQLQQKAAALAAKRAKEKKLAEAKKKAAHRAAEQKKQQQKQAQAKKKSVKEKPVKVKKAPPKTVQTQTASKIRKPKPPPSASPLRKASPPTQKQSKKRSDPATQRDIAALALVGMRRQMPDISALVVSHWRKPTGYNGTLSCVIEVSVDREGRVLRTRVIESSGDAFFDRSVDVAIYKSSPLPIPTRPEYYDYLKTFHLRFIPGS